MEKVNHGVVQSNSRAAKRKGTQSSHDALPLKKRLLRSNTGANGFAQSDICPEDKPRNNSLPAKTLQEIFSYLDHDDLLSARLACITWNSAVVNWPEFMDNGSFTVRRNLAADSYAILKSSTVPWKNVELKNFKTSNYPSWRFPTQLNQSLTSLTLLGGTITWSWLLDVTSQFQSLQRLALLNCKMELQNNVRWFRSSSRDSDEPVRPRRMNTRKQGITLKLEMEDYASLNFCLRQFTTSDNSPFVLTALELSIPQPKYEDSDDDDSGIVVVPERVELLLEFARLVLSCQSSRSVKLVAGEASGNASFECHDILKEDNMGLMLKAIKSKYISSF